jgi:hypothetical protein
MPRESGIIVLIASPGSVLAMPDSLMRPVLREVYCSSNHKTSKIRHLILPFSICHYSLWCLFTELLEMILGMAIRV